MSGYLQVNLLKFIIGQSLANSFLSAYWVSDSFVNIHHCATLTRKERDPCNLPPPLTYSIQQKNGDAGNIRRPNMNEKADKNTDEKRTWITVALWFGTIAFLGLLKRVLDRQKFL
jgi:hypothetical protein